MDKTRLLVVDDEELVRSALQAWFERRGFSVDMASSGPDAIAKCAANEYDVVTMDIEMPQMDGAEAIAAIRRFRPNLPFVILTAEMDPPERGNGVVSVLAKPASLWDVEHHVRLALAS